MVSRDSNDSRHSSDPCLSVASFFSFATFSQPLTPVRGSSYTRVRIPYPGLGPIAASTFEGNAMSAATIRLFGALYLCGSLAAATPALADDRSAEAILKEIEAIMLPEADLSFNDAITGAEISMERLRGKIVVVDFWATWCGPCVAEMPRMNELYAKYHDKGVEFTGVSLDHPRDESGLDSLKAFVATPPILSLLSVFHLCFISGQNVPFMRLIDQWT